MARKTRDHDLLFEADLDDGSVRTFHIRPFELGGSDAFARIVARDKMDVEAKQGGRPAVPIRHIHRVRGRT